MIETVLCDLDGTLVDTAPGILESWRRALELEGLTARIALDESVIGPPLGDTILRLTDLSDPSRVESLASTFKRVYDATGVLAVVAYPGLLQVLDTLVRGGRRVYVVTNKRESPARSISDSLGMSPFLSGLYGADTLRPSPGEKSRVVASMLATHRIDPAGAVMIGDSADDRRAASYNGIRFLAATYGYGDPVAPAPDPIAERLCRISDLPRVLAGLE